MRLWAGLDVLLCSCCGFYRSLLSQCQCIKEKMDMSFGR